MYLKALEIYGFKSFANKVKMPLNNGITCIVGPNGCGKSNVVDSVKWCIGEMSWKSLRMPSMLDVIFSGTTKRQPLNMGEVSMTFDNSERKLPLDFSEVTVTRKIYRSEESEYFINKVQCRLKDIREMFLDTGIGTDGYAIIDQGQVEKLLGATSEERREMFEEAAGVSKYKSKREEAAHRLEKVEADLNRLSDSMVLLDEQIKKLDAEARKARLQKKYREELKGAEISLLVKERNSFASKMEESFAGLGPVVKDISEIQTSITGFEAALSALNISITQKSEEHRLLREAATAVKFEKNNLEGRIVHNQQTLQDIAGSRASLATSEKMNSEKVSRLEPRIAELKSKIAGEDASFPELQKKFAEASEQLTKTANEIKTFEASASAVAAQMNALYSREINLSNSIAKAGSDIGHYKEDIIGLERDKAELSDSEKKWEMSSRELINSCDSLKQALQKEKEILSAAEAEIKRINEEFSKTDKRCAEIREEKAWKNSRLQALIAQGEKDTYYVGINSIINSGINGVMGTLRRMVKIKKSDMLAVEDTLGRFLDAVVCKNTAAAKEAISLLENSGKGRCRFIVLDKVPALTNADLNDASLVLKTISCSDELKPLIANLAAGVTSSESTVYGNFWMTGGVSKVVSNEPYWGEEGELKETIAALDAEVAKLEENKKNLIPELESKRKAASTSRDAIIRLNMELHTTESKVNNSKENLKISTGRIILLEREKAKTEAELKNAQESLAKFEAELAEARKASETKKAEQASIEEKKEKLYGELALMKENLAVHRANSENFRRNIDSLKAELFRNESDLKTMSDESTHFSTRRNELLEREKNLNEDIKVSKEKMSVLMHDLAEKEILDRQLEDEINSLRQDYGRISANLKDSRELLAESERKKYQIETISASFKARMEETERRLIDEWDIQLKEAEEQYGSLETDHERVVFLRRRVESMGPVNMTAPEEYEVLTQRYGFITSQVEDLNKAKSDLRSAINKINDTTRDSFKVTFEKVREYFKDIYSLLFNGGEADLILTNPENLLETGVEILAHPPGKKPVSISQLSGGEKALTALSLLFSFFRVSPSPFCIMDETDAPLDEANIERFVRLIREFSSTTQFIVITHNKRTMEAADTIYGVTMEELGISKLISVDLKHAADMAQQNSTATVS